MAERTPFSPKQNQRIRVPVRIPQGDEKSMFEKATGREVRGGDAASEILKKRLTSNIMSHKGKRIVPGKAPSDITSMMAKRLTEVEKSLVSARSELAEKDELIQHLREKIVEIGFRNEEPRREDGALKRNYDRLQRQVQEMEAFLADYGMIWVGSDDASGSNDVTEPRVLSGSDGGKMWCPEDSVTQEQNIGDAKEKDGKKIDFDRIMKNIEELNVLAGEGKTKVGTDQSGAHCLQHIDPIRLVFYANGLMLFEGPFRSYDDPTTQLCIKDLTDGYFPYELHENYPEGIPFDVSDRRHEMHCAPAVPFPGSGRTLGSEGPKSKVHSLNETSDGKKLLARLPASVVRNGKVIDIRASLTEHTKSSAEKAEKVTIVVETDVVTEMKSTCNGIELEGAISAGKNPKKVATLRVTSDSGNETYIVKLWYTATIGDLRQKLNLHIEEGSYTLKTSYPRKTLEDLNISIEEAGLTPNAVLHIHRS